VWSYHAHKFGKPGTRKVAGGTKKRGGDLPKPILTPKEQAYLQAIVGPVMAIMVG
jgi:hypothetical protein